MEEFNTRLEQPFYRNKVNFKSCNVVEIHNPMFYKLCKDAYVTLHKLNKLHEIKIHL